MKKNLIRFGAVTLTALTLLPTSVPAAQLTEFGGATPLQWSVRMADSETHRLGDSRAWRPGRRVKWDYTSGLFTLSLVKLNEVVPTPDYLEFTKDAIGSFITSDGNIQGYKITDYNIDNVAPGKTVLALYQLTKEERYQKNADLLRRQLREHPRTSEGGFWHKQRYPWQMWLDGLFMGAPFYAEYVKMFNGPASDYDDIVKQYRLMDRAAYDPKTGLYWHAWDEKKQQNWANPTTGLSSNFWGRAVGWWAMAQVDVLDFLPDNHPGRAELISLIKKTADGVVKWQDAETGVWWQVLDQGSRKGNYREATCSAMFVYSMAKAVNRGYLSRDYVPAILKGYEGIIKHFIKTDGAGLVSLTSCCSVAGLSADRDGSYEYYLREPVIDNDLKGVGPFILAGIEMQKLLKLPLTAAHDIEAVSRTKTSVAKEWEQMPDILARISAPLIPGHRFSILDYGAVGDGKTDSSAAITKAIADAVKHGGGRVIVPPGDYVTGPIHLKSKINLHVEKGATLLFKTDPAAYLPLVFTRWEGMECWNYSPLIYAIDAEHIAVTGEGVLDGQADMTNWWPWKGRWKGRDLNPPGTPTQQAARDRLVDMVANNVPVSERRFGEGGYLRPSFIQPYRCKNVLIEGVSIRRSPMWEIHPVLSTNVIVRGVNILTHGPNNDGCNPESCRDVLIEDTVFDTGDDCIAIKSGRNNDGRRIGLPSENIIIRRNQMKQGHGGVTLGSEISGGARNVFVEDCVMDSPSLDRAIRFKSNAARGGITENIFVRDVTIGTVADAVLQIDFMYEEGPNGDFPPAVRNLVIENINVGKARRVLDIRGFSAADISGVRFYNSTIKGITQNDSVKDGDVKLVDCVVERQQ
jgi:unsaturated rhamnogalacturonyl hydrolase